MDIKDALPNTNDGVHTTFTLMRDVCYKYSKKASEVFFSYPVEAYLFIKFADSEEGHQFIRDKHEDKNEEENYLASANQLKKEAMASLKRMSAFT